MKILKHKVRRLLKRQAPSLVGTSSSADERRGALRRREHRNAPECNKARPEPVTDSTMESEPSTALYKVTTVGSKRYTV